MNFGNGTSSEEQLIYYFVSLFYHNAKNRYEYIDKQSGISVEADIYIPDERIVIEYDGGYWHKEKVKKDAQKMYSLTHMVVLSFVLGMKGCLHYQSLMEPVLQELLNMYMIQVIICIFCVIMCFFIGDV